MSKSRWPARIGSVLLLSFAGTGFAQGGGAPPNSAIQECARAYEGAQVQRSAGASSSAKKELERCQRDDCPAFIQSDCARWSKELEAEQPTVIFAAKRDARALIQVRVSVGDRVLVERLDDHAVELAPGEYDFRFEAPDGSVVVQHTRIQAFHKDRLVQVEFPPSTAKQRAAGSTSGPRKVDVQKASLKTQPSAANASSSLVLPWTLLAVGGASLGAGAGLAVWGHNGEVHLRETCSPNCTDSQLQPVRTKYLLSDISLGIGLVSLSAAAYLFLRHPSSERSAQATLPVAVVASTNTVQASYGARF